MFSPRPCSAPLFLAAGLGRLYVEVRRGRPDVSTARRATRFQRPGDPGASPGADGSGGAAVERIGAELSARSRATLSRRLGSPILFAIVYTSLASAVFFSLGVVANHALGLTPLVFLARCRDVRP